MHAETVSVRTRGGILDGASHPVLAEQQDGLQRLDSSQL